MTAPLPAARDLSARLTAILLCVTNLIFARGHLFAALAVPLHNRIARASRRLATLLARLADGTWRPRPHTPKPGTKGGPRPVYIPQGRAWLTRKLTYQAAGHHALQLEFLLNDPQTQQTLAAAPPDALKSLGRTLRPLAHILGVDLPKEFLLSPRGRGEPEGALGPSARNPPPPPQPPEPLTPHDIWRRAHRRGVPPPLYPALDAPLRRKTRI